MQNYKGMTVNERLYVSGFLDKFNRAIEEKNVQEVIKILKTVELDDLNIQAILKNKGLI